MFRTYPWGISKLNFSNTLETYTSILQQIPHRFEFQWALIAAFLLLLILTNLYALYHCAISRGKSRKYKVFWCAFIAVSSVFLFSLGSIIYGLKEIQWKRKLIYIIKIGLILYFGFSVEDYFRSWFAHLTFEYAIEKVEKEIEDPILKVEIKSTLNTLLTEQTRKEYKLAIVCQAIAMKLVQDMGNGLDDEEYMSWKSIVDKRKIMTRNEKMEFMMEVSKRNLGSFISKPDIRMKP